MRSSRPPSAIISSGASFRSETENKERFVKDASVTNRTAQSLYRDSSFILFSLLSLEISLKLTITPLLRMRAELIHFHPMVDALKIKKTNKIKRFA